jgi:putative ABC transport system permease protein
MIKIAWRNILRQKMQSGMTLAAIAFGVTALMIAGGWVNDVFVKLGEALIHSQSGHLQIYKVGFYGRGARTPEKFLIEPDFIKAEVRHSAEVADVMARLTFSGLLSNYRSDFPILGEGIEPRAELRLGTSLMITAGRQLEERDSHGVLIGFGLAQALQVKPGDRVTILANAPEGALNSSDLEVVGVFQTFSNDYDARAVKMPLAAAHELLARDAANAVVVSLKRTADTDQVAARLKEQLGPAFEIKTWTELSDFYEKTVELYKGQFGFLQVIILVAVLLSVVNVVNMGVFERIGTFGTMMALGNRRRQVFTLIMAEGALLGIIGSVVGAVLGVALALAISSVGIPMPPPPNASLGYRAEIQIVPGVMLMSIAIGVAATLFASFFPAVRVSRTPVMEALRANA